MPSGDHAGQSSRAPDELVRLRISPSFAGTVKTSPRAPRSARAPEGESATVCSHFLTLMVVRWMAGASVCTRTGTRADVSRATSYTYNAPPFSYTIRPEPSAARLGHLMSKSV